MKPILRPYQSQTADAVMEEFKTVNSTAAIWATGCGKSVLAAEIMQRMQPGRCLFLAHRRELIGQMEKHVKNRGMTCEVEMGERIASRGWYRDQVVCSSVQTQYSGKGQRRFPYNDFSLLVLDELHHYVGAPAFRGVVEYYRQNPNLKILGLSATPKRSDGAAIGQIFQTVANVFEICDAVREGWLVDVRQQFVSVNSLDYSHVKTTCGDLNGKDLRLVMEAEENVQGMIQPILEITYGAPQHSLHEKPIEEWSEFLKSIGRPKKSIIFATSILQAETFANILNRVDGGTAAFVCEKTNPLERAKILKDFSEEGLYTVANVDILGEGYDNPKVSHIFMARPTKSLSKYTQFIGRGTRPLPGTVDGLETPEERRASIAGSLKPWVTVVDFVGNSGRHKLVSTCDILSGKFDEEVLDAARERAKKDGNPVNMTEILEEEQRKRDEEKAKKKAREDAQRAKLVAKVKYAVKHVNPFEKFGLEPARSSPWDVGKSLTQKQTDLLLKAHIDVSGMPYSQQKQLFYALIKNGFPLSDKQIALLKRFGHDVRKITANEGRKILDQLAKNGWKSLPPTQPIQPPTPPTSSSEPEIDWFGES